MCHRERLVLLLQLLEQPHILYRDDGLVGEDLEQRDLVVGEGPGLDPVDHDCADRVALAKHWHRNHAAPTCRESDVVMILTVGQNVFDLDHCPAENGPSRYHVALWWPR